ncbi:MAG: hypothetical protein JXJ17_01800 [Anaerolineae bacterium]|nr:hypothetical protein [Anaerolineae bacterium]
MATQMVELKVRAENGQRETSLTIPDTTLWAEVVSLGVDALGLPTVDKTSGEQQIYHVWTHPEGEGLLQDAPVREKVVKDEELMVEILPEMNPARNPDDLHK